MSVEQSPGWRLLSRALIGGFAGGLTLIGLLAFSVSLAPVALVGISGGVAVAVAVVGPKLLDLLLSIV
ncbi:MAG: hypothetical protein M3680_27975 [Myxococcota bacterium]|nr:hypothetical protein [Myxococcota bacterium]